MTLSRNAALSKNATGNDVAAIAKSFVATATWAYQTYFARLWHNMHGLSVPEAFAAVGTAYATLKTHMDLLAQLLTAEGVALSTPPAGWLVTVNPDGSAKVTDVSPAAPAAAVPVVAPAAPAPAQAAAPAVAPAVPAPTAVPAAPASTATSAPAATATPAAATPAPAAPAAAVPVVAPAAPAPVQAAAPTVAPAAA